MDLGLADAKLNDGYPLSGRLILVLILAGIIINLTGLFDPIFSGDSALYAVISKSFANSGNFLDIFVNGTDWLDKPHFPFWLAALSMKLFGVSGFAYKLPSLLFFIVGIVYTYKLAARLYDRDVALLAVLVLVFPLHVFISNNDVRAESILIGLIMGGVYHFYRVAIGASLWHVVAGSLFCAAAVMTKGPFVVIVFASAIAGYLIMNRDVGRLLSWKWLLAGFLVLIFIVPELFALYRQFDMHPEKQVLGQTNVSGIKFFVWDTQFGRFFNTGPFKGTGSPGFYLHTLLWTFAPWALIAYPMLGRRLLDLFRRKPGEYLTVAGFLLMFIVFSASKFQLPYYVNILFPFLAIICANGIIRVLDTPGRWAKFFWVSSIIYTLAFLTAVGLMEIAFGGNAVLAVSGVAILMGISAALILRFEKRNLLRAVYCSAAAVGVFAIYANLVFYPRLLHYQAGSEAALFANEHFPGIKIGYSQYDNLLEFYAKAGTQAVSSSDLLSQARPADHLYLVDRPFLDELERQGRSYVINARFDDFRVTRLTKQFLDPRTRAEVVTEKYLITVAAARSAATP